MHPSEQSPRNRVTWSASDENHGQTAEGSAREDSPPHFSDRVTSLCKDPGAPTEHADPCAPQTDKASVCVVLSAPGWRDLSLSMTGGRLQRFIQDQRLRVHGQTVSDPGRDTHVDRGWWGGGVFDIGAGRAWTGDEVNRCDPPGSRERRVLRAISDVYIW